MNIKKSKGFTIIELLVVVAIIAVLAAIVLINVTQYINKGRNAAIEGNLGSAMTNAAVFYDDNSTYAGSPTHSSYTPIRDAINSIVGANPVTFGTATNWCACSAMKITNDSPANSTFCVDSTGYRKKTQNSLLCATRCPAAAACVD